MLKREEIQVKVLQRQNKSSGRGGKNLMANSVIVLNEGEANVKFADILTRNGTFVYFLLALKATST
jgi:hypothetical protein